MHTVPTAASTTTIELRIPVTIRLTQLGFRERRLVRTGQRDEHRTQLLSRARQPAAHGVLLDLEHVGDLLRRQPLEVRQLDRDLIVERDPSERISQQLAALAPARVCDRARAEVDDRRRGEIERRRSRTLAEEVGEPAPRDGEHVRIDVVARDPVLALDAREERLADQIRAVVADIRAKEPRDARPVTPDELLAGSLVAAAPGVEQLDIGATHPSRYTMRALRDLVDELLHAQVRATLFGSDLRAIAPQLGRLRILERLGAGAMGTVFAAFDPRLERRVAVKVLRGGGDASRVLAEARALAKLAHPNVVAVHDAGEAEGLVYVVMELVAGVSLRDYLATPRPWRDVLRVMREAAAGIAAAHKAGLVHRDIKPDNILVGEDRTRVVDFGLANPAASAGDTSAGTPLYMAPEVLAGAPATEASDQFSFGVTLFEALYGTRPHDVAGPAPADTLTPSAAAAARDEARDKLASAARRAANVPRPPGSSVPAWLHAIVTRALAADPSARFASMADVAAALGHERRRRTRFAIGALLVAGVGAGIAVGALARGGHGNPCLGGPARTAAVWNAELAARVKTSLGGAPWGKQTLDTLDARATGWQLSYRRVCEATRVRGEQSDALLALRMRCLDRALDRFGALVSALETLDGRPPPGRAYDATPAPGSASSVGAQRPAAGSASSLTSPDARPSPVPPSELASARAAAPSASSALVSAEWCETLTSEAELALPADPDQRKRALDAEHQLDHGWVAFSLGRYANARALADTSGHALADLPAPRLRAEQLALAAAVEARTGDPKLARAKLDEAQLAAADANAPELDHDLWARRMRNELFGGDPAKVLEWATFARAAAKRTGREGAEIDGIVGEALRAEGKLDAARKMLERALASTDALRPEQRAVIEMNLGSVELAQGDSTAALATLTRARDRVLAALGDHHPDLALYADKLAAAQRARGKLRDALRLHDQSLALRRQAFGDADRSIATSLLHRAQTKIEAGDIRGAKDDIARALTIREAVYGKDSPRLGEIFLARGDAFAAGGDRAEAEGAYERAHELDERFDVAARRYRIGADVTLDAIAPLAPGETPSVDRTAALAARIALLVAAKRTDDATALAVTLRGRYHPGLDPALALAVASAMFAASDRAGTAQLLATVAPALPNEPSRTALAIFVLLANASDKNADAQAAARAAIALYQALPELDRADMDSMWAISR